MRSNERRRAQFKLEQSLRQEILRSSKKNRAQVTAATYHRLFSQFPDHSVFDPTVEERERRGRLAAGMIEPLIPKGGRVLEVGCGKGDTLRSLRQHGCACVGVEPSAHMLSISSDVQDAAVLFGTADRLEFPSSSFNVVFCQEVLEHLHPEDVPSFFGEAFRVLKPGGILSVETPNRRTGPQDISRGFVRVAQGLHLKEWTVLELLQQFRAAGFKSVKGILAPQFIARRCRIVHRLTRVPARVKYWQDVLLGCVPGLRARTFIGKVIGLDDIFLFGKKPFSSCRA